MFSSLPLKAYGGSLGNEFPVELSIYDLCSSGCRYCFAALNKKSYRDRQVKMGKKQREAITKDSTNLVIKKIMKSISGAYNSESWIEYWIHNKAPLVYSNTTDPLTLSDVKYGSTYKILHLLNELQYPVFFQSKFLYDDRPQRNVLPFILENKSLVVYTTITTLNDQKAKIVEPGVISPTERLRRVEYLASKGKSVICALNPYMHGYSERPEVMVKAFADAGAHGVYFDMLHLSKSQMGQLPDSMSFLIDSSVNTFEKTEEGIETILMAHGEFADAAVANNLNYFYNPAYWSILEDTGCSVQGQTTLDKFPRMKTNMFDFSKAIENIYRTVKQPILMTFDDAMDLMEIDGKISYLDHVFSAYDLFGFYNAKVTEGTGEFYYRLGKKCTFRKFLRYIWNGEHDARKWLFLQGGMKRVTMDGSWIVDKQGDYIVCYDSGLDSVDWANWYGTMDLKELSEGGYVELQPIIQMLRKINQGEQDGL